MTTNAEAKVKELSEKLLDIITYSRNASASPETTLEKLEAYLSGICDGIDLSDDMRSIQESTPAQKQPAILGKEG